MKMPHVTRRRIGDVHIFDLRGELVGPWALKEGEHFANIMKREKPEKLLISMKGLDNVDSLGVKAVMENIPKRFRGGVIQGKHSVMQMFDRVCDMERFKVFHNDEEILGFFGKDFVEGKHETDRRHYPRLRTALPVEFYYESEVGGKVRFRAIVTDLSEGGLFIEYLDLDEASASVRDLNPYDFKMLRLSVKLPGEPPVEAWGKVVHVLNEGDQIGMGIEFYDIDGKDKKRIADFLE